MNLLSPNRPFRRVGSNEFILSRCLCLLTIIIISGFIGLTANAHAETAESLITDVIRKARAARKAPPTYEFTRTKVSTFYKSETEVASEEKKIYRSALVNGKFRSRLLSINDQPPPPRAPRPEPSDDKEKDKEKQSEKAKAKPERNAAADSILGQISDDAVHRFDYKILSHETHEGRGTFLIEVKPRKGLKTRTIEEEVMAELAGKVWVDQEEHEILKAELALQNSVRIGWGGILGALREFKLSVVRSRHPNGEWINASSEVWIHYRQLFTSKRIRLKETVSDVQPLPLPRP